MSSFRDEDATMGEFDLYGFVSQAGHAIAECLDAAGVDGQIDTSRTRHAVATGLPSTAQSDA